MPVWRDKTKPSSKSVCDRQTDTENVTTVTLSKCMLRVSSGIARGGGGGQKGHLPPPPIFF